MDKFDELVEFLKSVASRYVESKGNERYGQAAFNVLAEIRPDLSEQIRGTALDPFYWLDGDSRLVLFFEWVDDNWWNEGE